MRRRKRRRHGEKTEKGQWSVDKRAGYDKKGAAEVRQIDESVDEEREKKKEKKEVRER